MDSSRVIINPQTNIVILITMPANDLKISELASCEAQTNQTAVYEVQIGSILFRSNFEFYNAFTAVNISLYPQDGQSASDAAKFVLASYKITFLNDNLIQSGAVGQLLETYYNYNECVLNPEIQFTTYKSIQPTIQVNPNCIISTTGDPFYTSTLNDSFLYNGSIAQSAFDFLKITFESMNCGAGTLEEQQRCSQATVTISSSNFIAFKLLISIPRKISTQNVFIDPYGKEQNQSVEIPFNLVFVVEIQHRITSGDCITSSHLSFSNNVVHVQQTPGVACPFQEFFKREYWIAVQDKSGYTFQLQFHSNTSFDLDMFVSCDTWEISEFDSFADCATNLTNVSSHLDNIAMSVIYKAWNKDNTYVGSYIFASSIIPGGEVELVLTQGQLCINIEQQLSSSRAFAGITIKIADSLQQFQDADMSFSEVNNFLFPSVDNVYCYSVNATDELLINQISFYQFFGVVYVLGYQLQVTSIDPLVQFADFWQGWVLLVVSFILSLSWVIVRAYLKKKLERSVICYQ
ncbi:hypothetical protein SS50377_22677 [Spironucleus salmonicida]|nr:hypothetical protein SS50377_22677 [Spironucleus salmonicida]